MAKLTRITLNDQPDIRIVDNNFQKAETMIDEAKIAADTADNKATQETTRATQAEVDLSTGLQAEEQRAKQAEQGLSAGIANANTSIIQLNNVKLDKTTDIKAVEKVNALPASPDANTLYVVPGSSGGGSSLYVYAVYIHQYYGTLSPAVDVEIYVNIVSNKNISNIMINAESFGDGSFTSNDIYDALLSILPADTTITGDYFPRQRCFMATYQRTSGGTTTIEQLPMAYLTASQSYDNRDEFVFGGRFAMRRVDTPDVFSYDGDNSGTLSVIKVF